MVDKMDALTEQKAREIVSRHGVWHTTDLHEAAFAKGYLLRVEQEKVLRDEVLEAADRLCVLGGGIDCSCGEPNCPESVISEAVKAYRALRRKAAFPL